MRIWARQFKDTRMLCDYQVTDNSDETRTHKIFNAIEKISKEMDLPNPVWLNTNIKEFKKTSKVRFRRDSYIEEVPFDYLEIQVIEED